MGESSEIEEEAQLLQTGRREFWGWFDKIISDLFVEMITTEGVCDRATEDLGSIPEP